MTAETAISRARTRLLLDQPWFGSLSMRLRMQPAPEISTFSVDGTTLRYNPEFALSLPESQLIAVLAHEVMHCALLHPFRRGSRDPFLWNVAADYVINHELDKAGFELPADVLRDPRFDGMAVEPVYATLRDESQDDSQDDSQGSQGSQDDSQGSQGSQDDSGDSGSSQDQSGGSDVGNHSGPSTGDVTDAPAPSTGDSEEAGPGESPEPEPMTAEDWEIAAEQAARVAQAAGRSASGAERAMKRARESEQDWRAILREFLEQTTPSDYSWMRPNRRFIGEGLYLPGTVKENIGRLIVAVDTSGSINSRLLDLFAEELTAVLREARPEAIEVVYCDAMIHGSETFLPDDADDIKLTPRGGGGTLFQPVFDWVAEDEERTPKALLYFTDLMSFDTPAEPDYPVLWITPITCNYEPAFGTKVRMDEDY